MRKWEVGRRGRSGDGKGVKEVTAVQGVSGSEMTGELVCGT